MPTEALLNLSGTGNKACKQLLLEKQRFNNSGESWVNEGTAANFLKIKINPPLDDETQMKTSHRNVALLLAILSCTGCARTVVVENWSLAEAELQGIDRIAISTLSGPQRLGIDLADQVTETIREQRSVQVRRTPQTPNSAIEAANLGRVAGADAILIGRVKFNRGGAYNIGGMQVQVGEFKHTISVEYQLIDTHTEQIRLSKTVTHSRSGEDDALGTNQQQELLAKVLSLCVNDVAQSIAPIATDIKIELARAGWGAPDGVADGSRAAANGNWAEAEHHWNDAVAQDPDCHAALFNLGVASEARNDFAQAHRYYQSAHAKQGGSKYDQAVARTRTAATNYAQVVQRRERKPTASNGFNIVRLPAMSVR